MNEAEIRLDERHKVYDELGVLYGEDARKFEEYMKAPAEPMTKEQEDMLKEVQKIVNELEQNQKVREDIREDERKKILNDLLAWVNENAGGISYVNDGLPFVWLYPLRDKIKDMM